MIRLRLLNRWRKLSALLTLSTPTSVYIYYNIGELDAFIEQRKLTFLNWLHELGYLPLWINEHFSTMMIKAANKDQHEWHNLGISMLSRLPLRLISRDNLSQMKSMCSWNTLVALARQKDIQALWFHEGDTTADASSSLDDKSNTNLSADETCKLLKEFVETISKDDVENESLQWWLEQLRANSPQNKEYDVKFEYHNYHDPPPIFMDDDDDKEPSTEENTIEIYLKILKTYTATSDSSSLNSVVNLIKECMDCLGRNRPSNGDGKNTTKDEDIHRTLRSGLMHILANISSRDEDAVKQRIVDVGFLNTLVDLKRLGDEQDGAIAEKILHNLDSFGQRHLNAGTPGNTMMDKVFQFHPEGRYSNEDVLVDVVFVHGVWGSPFYTWRQHDDCKTDVSQSKSESCWPKKWLASDIPEIRILALQYDAHLTYYGKTCPKNEVTIAEHASELGRQLVAMNVGSRPIVWVTHSLGGLIVKQLLVQAMQSTDMQEEEASPTQLPAIANAGKGDPNENVNNSALVKNLLEQALGFWNSNFFIHTLTNGAFREEPEVLDRPQGAKVKDLLTNTTGIVFYAVPHLGSPIASKVSTVPLVYPSSLVLELSTESPTLMELHRQFSKLHDAHPMEIISFCESLKTSWKSFKLPNTVVPPESCFAQRFTELYECRDRDHINICKPKSRSDMCYAETFRLIAKQVEIERDLLAGGQSYISHS